MFERKLTITKNQRNKSFTLIDFLSLFCFFINCIMMFFKTRTFAWFRLSFSDAILQNSWFATILSQSDFMKKVMFHINFDCFLLIHKNTRADDVIMNHVMRFEIFDFAQNLHASALMRLSSMRKIYLINDCCDLTLTRKSKCCHDLKKRHRHVLEIICRASSKRKTSTQFTKYLSCIWRSVESVTLALKFETSLIITSSEAERLLSVTVTSSLSFTW
jgi:hypothetical protein